MPVMLKSLLVACAAFIAPGHYTLLFSVTISRYLFTVLRYLFKIIR